MDKRNLGGSSPWACKESGMTEHRREVESADMTKHPAMPGQSATTEGYLIQLSVVRRLRNPAVMRGSKVQGRGMRTKGCLGGSSNLNIGADSKRRNLPGNEWISDLSAPTFLVEQYFFLESQSIISIY